MERDLQHLSERIGQLEAQIGQKPPEATSDDLHTCLRKTQVALREQVPDEMAAASRAVTMLSHAAPRVPAAARARRQQALEGGRVVDAAVDALCEMELLVGAGLHAGGLVVSDDVAAGLRAVAGRVEGAVMEEMEKEDLALDELLVDFNECTARLNHRILSLAGKIAERDTV